MKLTFPAVKITSEQDHRVLPEDVVTEVDAKEIADRINSAFAKCSDVSTLATLTDGLIQLYRQFGMSPGMTLKAISEAVAHHSGLKVEVLRMEDLEQPRRVPRAPPVRRRHH